MVLSDWLREQGIGSRTPAETEAGPRRAALGASGHIMLANDPRDFGTLSDEQIDTLFELGRIVVGPPSGFRIEEVQVDGESYLVCDDGQYSCDDGATWNEL